MVLADGTYLVSGDVGADTEVARVTSGKQILWQKNFGSAGDDFAFQAVQAGDGSLYVVGMNKCDCNCGYLLHLDLAGNTIDSKNYGTPGCDQLHSITAAPGGHFVMTGLYDGGLNAPKDAWVLTVTEGLSQVWQSHFGSPNSADRGKAVITAHESGYLVAGYTYSYGAGDMDVWLLKVSESGELLASATAGGTGEETPVRVAARPGGGYVAVGYTNSVSAGDWDGFVLLFDEDDLLAE